MIEEYVIKCTHNGEFFYLIRGRGPLQGHYNAIHANPFRRKKPHLLVTLDTSTSYNHRQNGLTINSSDVVELQAHESWTNEQILKRNRHVDFQDYDRE